MLFHRYIIGVSLSEPHSSITALLAWLCMLVLTDHLLHILNEYFNYFSKVEHLSRESSC